MRLVNEQQLKNTQRKLASLEELISKKEVSPAQSRLHQMSLNSMKRLARKLKDEIAEFERSHQIA